MVPRTKDSVPILCSWLYQPNDGQPTQQTLTWHTLSKSLPSPKPRAPPCSPIDPNPRISQFQLTLFSPHFPVQLRLQVYELVLGDITRLMHIIPFDDGSNRLGRRRCGDVNIKAPTWQHRCFETWVQRERSARVRQQSFRSSDRLLALCLSCRMMFVMLYFKPKLHSIAVHCNTAILTNNTATSNPSRFYIPTTSSASRTHAVFSQLNPSFAPHNGSSSASCISPPSF